MRLLIADDNKDVLHALGVLLSGMGYEVIEARNGVEALEAARGRKVDLIIADILMPVMDGFALCRQWKADETLRDIPFIFYTSNYTDERDRDFALSLGAERFALKPMSPGDFLAMIREVIEESHARVASREPVEGEIEYLRKYNEALIRKLEDNLLRSEHLNRQLEQDIAERRKIEEALRESELRFRSIFDNEPECVKLLDPDGRLLEMNAAGLRMIEAESLDQVVGQMVVNLVVPEHCQTFQTMMERVLNGEATEAEFEIIGLRGSRRWMESHAVPLRNPQGRIIAVLEVTRDVTERKLAEQALHRSSELMKAISLAQSRYLSNLNVQQVFDQLLTALLSLTESEYGFIGETLYDHNGDPYLKIQAITNIAWNEWSRAFYEKYASTGLEFRNLKTLFGRVMTSRQMVISNDPLNDSRRGGLPEGHPALNAFMGLPFFQGEKMVGMVGIANRAGGYAESLAEFLSPFLTTCANIIEAYRNDQRRRWAEERLRQSEERYRILFETSPDALALFDPRMKLLMVNQNSVEMYGYESAEEMIGRPGRSFLAPEDWTRAREQFSSLRENGSYRNVEFTGLRKDGSRFPVDLSASLIVDSDGRYQAIIGVSRDITERKRAEALLRAAEERYRSIIQNAVYGIYLSSPEGKFIEVNPALVRMLGYDSAQELMAVDIVNDIYVDKDERARLVNHHRDSKSLDGIEVRWKRKDGRVIDVRLSGAFLRDESGQNKGVEVIVEDITERKLLEEQLRQSQKMEAIGRLAGGVAHDFNNLLTAINGYAEVVLMQLTQNNLLYKDIEEIRKAGQRAASLTNQLLAFSRRQIIQPRVLNINSVINDSLKMLRRLIGEDIELLTSLSPEAKRIKADPGQIEQVIMNLAINARDAMPQGGRLTIETRNVYLDEGFARKHSGARLGRYVMLAISDTGCGMNQETRLRVFEPFFTTKDVGKGTGLGLSTVYGIVKQSGGHIQVESQVGAGAVFRIYLPMVDQEAEEQSSKPAASSNLTGSETILIVEDEESVRKLARIILTVQGYTVIEAASGPEALEMVRKSPVDLLITDVVMPQMSGRELAERFSREHPTMKVLYISGYLDEVMGHHGVIDTGLPLLTKPFSPEALTEKVRVVLDG
jgi:PAS domain S-box-containing protein